MIDIQKERAAFETWWENFHNGRQISCDYVELDNSYAVGYANAQWVAWQAAKAQAIPEGFVLVPKKQQREGGYYLRDLRGPIGNCMKFWYTSGYGTKLEKFHWFPTLEDALSSKGGADWFEPWYASYIDSIAEKTIDFQLADRSKEKAMIETAEDSHENRTGK